MCFYTMKYGSILFHNLQHCKLSKPKTLSMGKLSIFSSCICLNGFWLQETKNLTEAKLDNEQIHCPTKLRSTQVGISEFVDLSNSEI